MADVGGIGVPVLVHYPLAVWGGGLAVGVLRLCVDYRVIMRGLLGWSTWRECMTAVSHQDLLSQATLLCIS